MKKLNIWDIYPDMNGDGKHDAIDFFLWEEKKNELQREEEDHYIRSKDAKCEWRDEIEDDFEFDIDPEDYEDQEDYEEALEKAKLNSKTTWCDEESEFNELNAEKVDFEDYDVKDYYGEKSEEADELFSGELEMQDDFSADMSLTFSVEVSYPGERQLQQIKESDYPNKRTYDAAYALCEIEHGDPFIPSDTTKEKEAEKYRFILSQSCIAARYLTKYDGFIYVQAIKEHFDLPINVPDEDNAVNTSFTDFFMELAEEDVSLAIDVWAWCIKEFGAYQIYMENRNTIYNHIIFDIDDYPEEFSDRLIDRLGTDQAFRKGLLTDSPDIPYSVSDFISKALITDRKNIAQEIFNSAMQNPVATGKWKEDVLERLISDSSNWEELETMEAVRQYILPLAKKMSDKRIQRVFPKLVKKADEYIEYVEISAGKYRYSRRYLWRAKYKDKRLENIDPLQYETEQEYLEAVQIRKYGWRQYIPTYKHKFADPSNYETVQEFNAAYQVAADKEYNNPTFKDHDSDDKNIYKFCKVELEEYPNNKYYYFPGTLALNIGDRVIVPFGRDNEEIYGIVVSVGECYGSVFPCAIENIKYVKKANR